MGAYLSNILDLMLIALGDGCEGVQRGRKKS